MIIIIHFFNAILSCGNFSKLFLCLLLVCFSLTGCRQDRRREKTLREKDQQKMKDEFAFLNKEKQGIYYKLKPGEGLYTVSRKYDVPVTTLVMENDIADIHDIPAGKKIFIPLSTVQPEYDPLEPEPRIDIVPEEKPPGNRPVAGRQTGSFSTLRGGVPLKGCEFRVNRKSNVYAVRDGQVSFRCDSLGSFGPSVIIKESSGKYLFYGNLSAITVTPGSRIRMGQVIGLIEKDATLHVKYIRNDQLIDPGRLWK